MIIIIVYAIITIILLIIFYELCVRYFNRRNLNIQRNEVTNSVFNDVEIGIPQTKSYKIYDEKKSIPNIKPFDYIKYNSINEFSDESKLNNNTVYNKLSSKNSIIIEYYNSFKSIINSDRITQKKQTENTQLLSSSHLTRSLSENDANKYKCEYEKIERNNGKKVVLINV